MMSKAFTNRFSLLVRALAVILLVASAVAVGSVATTASAVADTASAKALVDSAKARGEVGEQGDGFLGLVDGSVNAAVASAMGEINTGRAQAYREAALKAGVTPEAAGEATALQLFARMPPGQFYKPLGGTWTKK